MKPFCAFFRHGLVALLLAISPGIEAHRATENARLPVVGPAPDFVLLDQDGTRFSLRSLRGQVAIVTFIYATCTDTCPLLTAKLASLQAPLASDFGTALHFVSITVDPQTDTPAVLKSYAKAQGANLAGWSFLTGTPTAIDEVIRSYGAFAKRSERGGVDHLFLTSLVDRHGRMGYRFKTDEMMRDIRSLLRE